MSWLSLIILFGGIFLNQLPQSNSNSKSLCWVWTLQSYLLIYSSVLNKAFVADKCVKSQRIMKKFKQFFGQILFVKHLSCRSLQFKPKKTHANKNMCSVQGHSRAGTVPHHHHLLLQRSHGHHAGLWHHQRQELRKHQQMAAQHWWGEANKHQHKVSKLCIIFIFMEWIVDTDFAFISLCLWNKNMAINTSRECGQHD